MVEQNSTIIFVQTHKVAELYRRFVTISLQLCEIFHNATQIVVARLSGSYWFFIPPEEVFFHLAVIKTAHA